MLDTKDCTTVLANERTYAAWVRTGLASFATGLGVERFLGGVIPDPVIRAISMSLFSFSILTFILGALRYVHVEALIPSSKATGAPVPLLLLLTIVLVSVTLLAMIGVWLI